MVERERKEESFCGPHAKRREGGIGRGTRAGLAICMAFAALGSGLFVNVVAHWARSPTLFLSLRLPPSLGSSFLGLKKEEAEEVVEWFKKERGGEVLGRARRTLPSPPSRFRY